LRAQDGNLCPLDLLWVSGLTNYFGKSRRIDEITINPVLLEKGSARIALYGLGHIRDERLYRTFEQKQVGGKCSLALPFALIRLSQVKFTRPSEEPDSWFNIMCIHQNRCAEMHGNDAVLLTLCTLAHGMA
jgi:double-strand break repair protein MRE11